LQYFRPAHTCPAGFWVGKTRVMPTKDDDRPSIYNTSILLLRMIHTPHEYLSKAADDEDKTRAGGKNPIWKTRLYNNIIYYCYYYYYYYYARLAVIIILLLLRQRRHRIRVYKKHHRRSPIPFAVECFLTISLLCVLIINRNY